MDGTDVWGRPRAPRQWPVQCNISIAVNRRAKPGRPAVYQLAVPTRYGREAQRIWTLFYPSFVLPIGTSDAWVKEFAHQCEISGQNISSSRMGKRWSSPTQAQDRIS